jgi:hypothetical protein
MEQAQSIGGRWLQIANRELLGATQLYDRISNAISLDEQACPLIWASSGF